MVHDLEHVGYLASGLLVWTVVLGRGSAAAAARVGLAVGSAAPVALLGVVLTSANRPLYATYRQSLGFSEALADQRAGASLMWIGSMLGGMVLIMVSVYTWAAREQRSALRREALQDRAAGRPGTTI